MELTSDYWNERYLNHKTGWDRGCASPVLNYLLNESQISAPKCVLVPGCGNGHEVVQLATKGFKVVAVDFAEEPVKKVRSRLRELSLHAEVIQNDILTATLIPKSFDFIYEQTCLCALHPEHWPHYAGNIKQWLKPEGLLLAAFMQSKKHDAPPFHCGLEEMRKLFDTASWHWNDEYKEFDHPAGLREFAVVLTKRKEGSD